MLFLLNDQIVELDSPEAHLLARWKILGCGEPYLMRAREALDFTAQVMTQLGRYGQMPSAETVADLAALIVSKTGANAILFARSEGGRHEPRLTTLPEHTLEALRGRADKTGAIDIKTVWPMAA